MGLTQSPCLLPLIPPTSGGGVCVSPLKPQKVRQECLTYGLYQFNDFGRGRACPCPQWGQAQGIAPTKDQRFFNRYKL